VVIVNIIYIILTLILVETAILQIKTGIYIHNANCSDVCTFEWL